MSTSITQEIKTAMMNGAAYDHYDVDNMLDYDGYQDIDTNDVMAILDTTTGPERTYKLGKLGLDRSTIKSIVDVGEPIYPAKLINGRVYIDGFDKDSLDLIRWNKETGIGTAEVREVSYSYEYDIDQEVCQDGDREYVHTYITDTHETEHVDEYEINIHIVNI